MAEKRYSWMRGESSKKESTVEDCLRKRVKAAGGKAYKFKSPGNNGVPDRIVLLPGARIAFVETKALGKRPTDDQEKQIVEISAMGFDVRVIDSKEKVDALMRDMEAEK